MSTKALADLQASSIDSILQEQRSFPPPPEFTQQAHIKSLEEYERLYKESMDDPDKFWSRIANELHWFKKWDKVLDCNLPSPKSILDAHLTLPSTRLHH